MAVVLVGCIGPVYFVNSSLALVVFFRRRFKSVAEVLKGIRDKGIHFFQVECSSGVTGRLFVVMVRVVLSLPSLPG